MRCYLHHCTSGGIMCGKTPLYPCFLHTKPYHVQLRPGLGLSQTSIVLSAIWNLDISSGLIFPDVAETFVQES